MVKINGENKSADGMTLSQYLTANGFDGKRIAVEYNGDILPRDRYPETVMSDGDSIEIVCFVGGG